MNAVLNLLEYEAHKKQVELSFEAAKDPPLIHADSDGIQQIVLNLVSNALTATGARRRIVVGVEPCQTGTDPAHSEAVEAVQLTAALPFTLVESELFGVRKGAHTDAREHRSGLFVEAEGWAKLRKCPWRFNLSCYKHWKQAR